MAATKHNSQAEAEIESEQSLSAPKRFKVLLLNDDYTPMEFVVEVLVKVFHMPANDAKKLTMKIHKNGKGVAGVYPKGIAESLVLRVRQISTANHHVLTAIIEEEA